jgi:NADH-quinone oxidoreductase subunit A
MIDRYIAESYLPILILIGLAFSIGFLLVFMPNITAKRVAYSAKNSQYECGFKGFSSVRKKFDVKFYLISILFIVFDIEIAFLFPWAADVKNLGLSRYISVMVFFLILTIGFLYEWKKGALDN